MLTKLYMACMQCMNTVQYNTLCIRMVTGVSYVRALHTQELMTNGRSWAENAAHHHCFIGLHTVQLYSNSVVLYSEYFVLTVLGKFISGVPLCNQNGQGDERPQARCVGHRANIYYLLHVVQGSEYSPRIFTCSLTLQVPLGLRVHIICTLFEIWTNRFDMQQGGAPDINLQRNMHTTCDM